MKTIELISEDARINITITIDGLDTWDGEVYESTQHKIEDSIKREKPKKYYSPKQTSKMLEVDLSTLWRWKKRGYLVPIKVGGKSKYKDEDINAIQNGRE